jgi:BASS family bile acid:Na+ symporter
MIKRIYPYILHRNVILVLAVVLGLASGAFADGLKPYTTYILMVTMMFSMTGMATRSFFPLKKTVRPMLAGTVLNYVFFGGVMVLLAWFLMPTRELFMGFVVIAVAPPGVAIVPFAGILKGDIDYSIIGVTGAFLASVAVTPLVLGIFDRGDIAVTSGELIWLMVKLVVIPLLLSRLLLLRGIEPMVKRIRGKVVDIGFALIIYTAIGMNRELIFHNQQVLLLSSLVLIAVTFGLGSLFELIMKQRGSNAYQVIPQTLLLTVKSSGFSVITAMAVFGEKAAIPSALFAIIVLLYLLFLTTRSEIKK